MDQTIDITHDVCVPLALTSAAPTAIQAEGLEAAQALWRTHGAPALGWRAGGATLEVRFEQAAGAFFGLYDDEAGVIYINQRITDPTALSIVIAHELGHAFGLEHVLTSERVSLMNPGNTSKLPTEDDQRALEALWGTCD